MEEGGSSTRARRRRCCDMEEEEGSLPGGVVAPWSRRGRICRSAEVGRIAGGGWCDASREREEGVWSGTHNLEGEMEGLQEWRVGGGIWRGMQNRGLFRGSAGVVFLHRTSKFWSNSPWRPSIILE
jgi:hypothetical protein